MKVRKGFTLVEILIVVVILGILAAIVIPQFSNASTDAKENALKSNLQTIRSQIELYKIQHNDTLPPGGSFEDVMTQTTDASGATTGSDYGPYLKSIPSNPFNNSNTVATGTTNPTTGTADTGWFYNTDTGDFLAYDNVDPNHLEY